MKWLDIILAALLLVATVQPLPCSTSNLERVIPETPEQMGWQAEGEPIITYDGETLSMIINGAAERYIRLGTQRAAFVNYEKKQVYMMLEIYETVSETHSRKLFDEFASDRSTPVRQLGSKARSTDEMGGSYMVEYFQGRFFVRASVSKTTDSTKRALKACTMEISDRISGIGGK
jgi:hypothetical protein